MLLMTVLFFLLLILGMPIALAIGIAGFSFFLTSGSIPVSIGVQQVATASQSFPLLAVPFFVLAGHMMNQTGLTPRLIACSNVLVSWMAGGLAQVSIVLSTLMGGVAGSAVAEAAMEARILGPDMIKSGYAKGFTAATIAVGSLITATLPPSIGLILYGFVGNVSIGRLFLAGVVPGLLMMAVLMLTVGLISHRRGYRAEMATRPSGREVARALWHAKWAIMFPVLLLIAIRGGFFTPSEIGAAAVLYAVVVGVFFHRELTIGGLFDALREGVLDIGVIMFIILMSGMIGYAIIFEQAPQTMAMFMTGLTQEPLLVLFLVLLFVLLCGLFIESTVMVLLLTPIFVPIITPLGIDTVHFGILMMTVVTLGGMTPPVGVAMYTVCGILRCPIDDYVRDVWPFLLAIVTLILFLALFPSIVLFLPNLLM